MTARGRQPVAIRRSVVAGSAAGYVGTGGFGVLTSAGLMLVLFIASLATPTAFGPAAAALWVLEFFLLAAVTDSLFQVSYISSCLRNWPTTMTSVPDSSRF